MYKIKYNENSKHIEPIINYQVFGCQIITFPVLSHETK